uniref:ORF SG7F10.50c n=1 Tax=Streptomyces griseus subsp. griseus TaxID=67263 RepID=Q53IA2_STRGR|nr:unnamed protein product [Streptomyces griseus subsp. griseus]
MVRGRQRRGTASTLGPTVDRPPPCSRPWHSTGNRPSSTPPAPNAGRPTRARPAQETPGPDRPPVAQQEPRAAMRSGTGGRGTARRAAARQWKTTERTFSRSEAPPVCGRRGNEAPSQSASVKTSAQASVRFFGECPDSGFSGPTPGRLTHSPLGGLFRKPVAAYPSTVT